MMRWLPLLFLFLATAVQAQSYLPQADLATCQARSAAQCQALGCDGKTTLYWWNCQKLMDSTAAVETRPGDPQFDATTTNAVAKSPTGLSAGEQSALQTRAAMGTKLPDIIASANWLAKLTAAQKNTITTWAANHPGEAADIWNAIKGGADADLRNANLLALVQAGLNGGLINDARATDLLTPQTLP